MSLTVWRFCRQWLTDHPMANRPPHHCRRSLTNPHCRCSHLPQYPEAARHSHCRLRATSRCPLEATSRGRRCRPHCPCCWCQHRQWLVEREKTPNHADRRRGATHALFSHLVQKTQPSPVPHQALAAESSPSLPDAATERAIEDPAPETSWSGCCQQVAGQQRSMTGCHCNRPAARRECFCPDSKQLPHCSASGSSC